MRLDPGEAMRAITKIWRATESSTRDFAADRRALAATEFAVIVPLMLVLFFGTVEFSSAIAIHRKVTLIARTLSDLTSQSLGKVADSDLQNTFTASISIITPYDDTQVKAAISQIAIDSKGIATVQWSKGASIASGASQATLTTSPRSPGDKVTSMIPTSLLVPSTYLILSEVSYLYTPSVGYVLKSGITLSDASYTRPRQASCIAYNGVPTSC